MTGVQTCALPIFMKIVCQFIVCLRLHMLPLNRRKLALCLIRKASMKGKTMRTIWEVIRDSLSILMVAAGVIVIFGLPLQLIIMIVRAIGGF